MADVIVKTVTKDMTVADILEKVPAAADIMQTYGLHCFGCHVNVYESLEQGALGHGMDEDVINSMVKEINEAASTGSSMTKADVAVVAAEDIESDGKIELNLTDNAAKKILEIMDQQDKTGSALRVGAIAGGCAGYTYHMDFEEKPKDDDLVAEVKGVRLFVDTKSAKLLKDITIDYVESLQGAGFKFNNPNAHASCGCGKSFS